MEFVVEQVAAAGARTGNDVLVDLVSQVWEVTPAQLHTVATNRGNPVLAVMDDSGRELEQVECSFARSGQWVAAACLSPGEGGWIGIDVEDSAAFVRSHTDPELFAQTVLGARELDWWQGLSAQFGERELKWLLLRAWVRKEAVAKSLHTGFLNLEPTQLECTRPGVAPECLSHPWVRIVDAETGPQACVSLAYNA